MPRIILILVIVCVAIATLVLVNLKISRVTCLTDYGACPDYLQVRVPNLVGLKWVDPIQTTALSQNFADVPEVKKITVEKKLPGSVTVNIVLRKPLGVVYSTLNRAQVATDDTGILFALRDTTNLPRLVVDSPLEIGGKLNTTEFTALTMLYQTSVVEQTELSAKIVDSALEIKNTTGQIIILSLIRQDTNWQYSLQAILTRSKIDGKVPQKIDLRFEDPVVVY